MIAAQGQDLPAMLALFLEGFVALLCVAVAAPLLGVLLVLRRMPLLGLAIPQVAGCGQAAVYFGFAFFAVAEGGVIAEPGAALQITGALGGVALGMLALVGLTRDRSFLGVHAGILFLAAIGLREVLLLQSPYHEIFEDAIHHGRLLTVDLAGSVQVAAASVLVVGVAAAVWRRLWLSAFDQDQAQLLGLSPRRHVAVTLLLVGGLCALCVPVVGPEVVLTLLLVPPAVLRRVAPSLGAYAPLSIAAGVLGSVAAFLLACAVNWPPGPALVLGVLVASLALAGVVAAGRVLTSRPPSIAPTRADAPS